MKALASLPLDLSEPLMTDEELAEGMAAVAAMELEPLDLELPDFEPMDLDLSGFELDLTAPAWGDDEAKQVEVNTMESTAVESTAGKAAGKRVEVPTRRAGRPPRYESTVRETALRWAVEAIQAHMDGKMEGMELEARCAAIRTLLDCADAVELERGD